MKNQNKSMQIFKAVDPNAMAMRATTGLSYLARREFSFFINANTIF